MDPREVIVIDESPPSSPVPENISSNNSNELDLSSTSETLSWSTFTATFISSTINSVNLDSDNMATNNGYNTMNGVTYTSECAVTSNDGYLQVAKNKFPRQYRSPYAPYNPDMSQYYPKTLYYQNYMHSIEVTNSYSYYPVHTNNTKTDSFYYFDGPSQTPMKIAKFDRDTPRVTEYPDVTISALTSEGEIAALQPEFVDVNAYVNYSTNINVPLNSSNQPALFQAAKQRKTISSSTPFFNQNRTVTITKMINGEPTSNVISSNKIIASNVAEDSDDSDIIFVGEYKTEAQVPDVVSSNSVKMEDSKLNTCEIKLERMSPAEKTDQNTTKTLPRRNPKRLVQSLKKTVIPVSELLETSKNRFRERKAKSNNKNTASEKNLRRSQRTKVNCGAVYCPPSPITIKHYREWPVDGMHERPEYDPVTNKIEPFDYHIRKISGKNQSVTKANADSCTSPDSQDNTDTLAQLCHEMLHHVLAYVATVKAMQCQEDEEEVLRATDSKMNFLGNLALEKTASFDEKVCNVLKDTVQNIDQTPAKTDSKLSELRELIENSIFLYCVTNNVSQSNVSKYIANMDPKDIIQLSNEKFGLLSNTSE